MCSFAVLSLPPPHRIASLSLHLIFILASAVALIRFSFLLDAQKVGTVGFGGRCCFFLFVFKDGLCERSLGFRNRQELCTVEDLQWQRSREQRYRVCFRHQEHGPVLSLLQV